jgi:molecular chaperone GrpE
VSELEGNETPDEAGRIEDELSALIAEAEDADTDAERPAAGSASQPAESEAMEQVQEFRALAQQVQADFENYRKRVIRDQADAQQRATQGLVEQLLPVIDSFELALTSLESVDPSIRKGFELVYAELLGVLERAGLQRVEAVGEPFDPHLHEAVLHEEGDGEPVVIETMRTGYRFQDKVLRPAMVRVGRAPTG